MKTVYDFYSDPRHGWLKVSRKELEELGIADDISSYSYQYNNHVYLEEDCDLGRFIEAKERVHPGFREIARLKEHYTDRSSRIRGYAPYCP